MEKVPFDTLPNTYRVTRVGQTVSFGAVCPIPSEPFVGVAEVEYQPFERVLEYESFARWARCRGVASLEEVTAQIYWAVGNAIAPHYLKVRCKAVSAAHPEAWVEKEGWPDADD